MSLDLSLQVEGYVTMYDGNITHNLGPMAKEAGVYGVLWRPEETGIMAAQDMLPALEAGLAKLEADEAHFRQFDSPNGWGRYEHLCAFVREVIEAARTYPTALVRACR